MDRGQPIDGVTQVESSPRKPFSGDAEVDEDQIAERLAWTPHQRLRYLLDMLAFEERSRRALQVPGAE